MASDIKLHTYIYTCIYTNNKELRNLTTRIKIRHIQLQKCTTSDGNTRKNGGNSNQTYGWNNCIIHLLSVLHILTETKRNKLGTEIPCHTSCHNRQIQYHRKTRILPNITQITCPSCSNTYTPIVRTYLEKTNPGAGVYILLLQLFYCYINIYKYFFQSYY